MFIADEFADRETALIVLADARRLAPCLDDLSGTDYETARAIINRSIRRSGELSSTLKSRTAGDWSQTRFAPGEAGSAILPDDQMTLRALCGIAPSAGPLCSFPPAAPRFQP